MQIIHIVHKYAQSHIKQNKHIIPSLYILLFYESICLFDKLFFLKIKLINIISIYKFCHIHNLCDMWGRGGAAREILYLEKQLLLMGEKKGGEVGQFSTSLFQLYRSFSKGKEPVSYFVRILYTPFLLSFQLAIIHSSTNLGYTYCYLLSYSYPTYIQGFKIKCKNLQSFLFDFSLTRVRKKMNNYNDFYRSLICINSLS